MVDNRHVDDLDSEEILVFLLKVSKSLESLRADSVAPPGADETLEPSASRVEQIRDLRIRQAVVRQ